jgi:hypothetical protein
MRLATTATAFSKAVEIIQDEERRKDRGRVFELSERKLPYASWSEADRHAGERVCHSYDQVGIMIRAGMFPKELIVDSWGDSLRRIWPILDPMVRKYRKLKGSREYWDDFEWLANEAEVFRASRTGK